MAKQENVPVWGYLLINESKYGMLSDMMKKYLIADKSEVSHEV